MNRNRVGPVKFAYSGFIFLIQFINCTKLYGTISYVERRFRFSCIFLKWEVSFIGQENGHIFQPISTPTIFRQSRCNFYFYGTKVWNSNNVIKNSQSLRKWFPTWLMHRQEINWILLREWVETLCKPFKWIHLGLMIFYSKAAILVSLQWYSFSFVFSRLFWLLHKSFWWNIPPSMAGCSLLEF